MDKTWESKEIEKHLTKKIEAVDDGLKWSGGEVEVKSDPLIDSGTGKPYVMRFFEFSMNPQVKYAPTKQELFNCHWNQIRHLLWRDGLVAYEGVEPRIVMGKKHYRIVLVCEPRLNTVVADRPATLQEIVSRRK